MPEAILLAAALLGAGLVVLAPLRRPPPVVSEEDELEVAAIRHRAALEALRDVEADRRAGSLDDAAYAEQVAEAEARAAGTRAALERVPSGGSAGRTPRSARVAVQAGGLIGLVLVGGSLVSASGIPNTTVTNVALAAAQSAEAARQERIAALLDDLRADPRDTATLSALADAYLEGATHDDLVRAAVALQLVIDLDPTRTAAYERLMAAYLRAGDAGNARAVWETYADVATADPIELAFFDGIIALRGEEDAGRAADAFDRFLQLAPDDPRAGMVRGLRDEAAGD
jgi:cytochrome c-type biogenesis protein CcmH/NrfG